MILYSKPFVEKNEREIIKKTRSATTIPVLAVVLVGSDTASLAYVRQKERIATRLGCGFLLIHLPKTARTAYVIAHIKKLNANTAVHGIIVQLPLPEKINTPRILSAIAQKKDVDNLRGGSSFISPAVLAIWHMLFCAGAPQKNDRIAIVGYGQTVGKPFHIFLLKRGFRNIAIIGRETKNLDVFTENADIIVSGVGRANLIRKVKKGARVIDAGTSSYKGKIVGDVDVARVRAKAALLTPVPGGVGPLTVSYLFKNVVLAAQRQRTLVKTRKVVYTKKKSYFNNTTIKERRKHA